MVTAEIEVVEFFAAKYLAAMLHLRLRHSPPDKESRDSVQLRL